MPKVETWERRVAWLISLALALIVLITAFSRLQSLPIFDEYVLLALVIALFPLSVLDYVDYHWRRSVDEHLPDLLRAIVQAEKTGMTLPQSVEEAAKRNYGSLTAELRRMVAQMSWGKSFEEVLESFSKRVNTSLTKRSIPLIIEASRSGGHLEKVFEPMSKFVQNNLMAEKERQAQTRPYVAIVYVAFFVFLFTVIMLFKVFFFEATDTFQFNLALLSIDEARRLFFHMSIVQGLFGGLVAGKMGEGAISAGLKHSVILLVAGYVALKFLV